jgi:hypothetical protein
MLVRSMLFATTLLFGSASLAATGGEARTGEETAVTAPGDDGSTPRPIRIWVTGKPTALDKASDALSRQGWRGIELHVVDRPPFFNGYLMAKADRETMKAIYKDLTALESTYGVKLASINARLTP